jgi:Muskelin N-terminus
MAWSKDPLRNHLTMSVNQALLQTLPYSIWDFSSHSASYHPRNIMENNPMDQSSRWSSGTNNQMQYITLKLDRPAIVRILFFFFYCLRRRLLCYKSFKPNGMPFISPMNLFNLDSHSLIFVQTLQIQSLLENSIKVKGKKKLHIEKHQQLPLQTWLSNYLSCQKVHVCNLKEFRVLGGASPNKMTELAHSGNVI